LKAPPHRIHRDRSRQQLTATRGQKTLTLRVSRNRRNLRTHASLHQKLAEKSTTSNRRIKVNAFDHARWPRSAKSSQFPDQSVAPSPGKLPPTPPGKHETRAKAQAGAVTSECA